MLQMICDWLITAIAGALNLFCTGFFRFFSIDPARFVDLFPALNTGYSIFRGLGYGLIFVFAVLALMQFFTPSLFGGRQPDDRPLGILIKAALATMLVFSGNYLLTYIIEIAKIPYDAFINASITGGTGVLDFFSFTKFSEAVVEEVGLAATGFGFAALAVLRLALVAVIGFNILKLLLEICERYLMVGVLLFTSPPFFAMVASVNTMNVFKSWIKMFISSCIMMSVSVFFTKVVLSGLFMIGTATGETLETFARMFLILAMCKIAQHADEYMARLGLGTATTGRPLLDDILVASKSVGGAFGGGKGGKAGGSSSSVMGTVGGAAAGLSPFAAGAMGAVQGVKDNYVNGKGQSIIEAAINGGKEGLANRADGGYSAKKAAANAVMTTFAPGMMAQKTGAAAANREQAAKDAAKKVSTAVEGNKSAAQGTAKEFKQHSSPAPTGADAASLVSVAAAGKPAKGADARNFQEKYGAGGGYTLDANGNLAATAQQLASGTSYDHETNTWGGNNAAVADACKENFSGGDVIHDASWQSYAEPEGATEGEIAERAALVSDAEAAAKDELHESITNTIVNGDASVADSLAFDPNAQLSGNDDAGNAIANRVLSNTDMSDVQDGRYSNFMTGNYQDSEVNGESVSGGHFMSATYTGTDGQNYQVTAIDETAYQARMANQQDVSTFTKTTSETGRTMYVQKETITQERLQEIKQEASRPSSYNGSTSAQNKDAFTVTREKIAKRNTQSDEAKSNNSRKGSGGNSYMPPNKSKRNKK